MKNLIQFTVHKWHNEPSLEEEIEYPFIVYEQCTNFPFIHFVYALSEEDALSKVYDSEVDSYTEANEEGPILSAEMINIDQIDIDFYHKISHTNAH